MSKTFRLSDTHPTMEKLRKIFSLASELGIDIDYSYGNAQVFVRDKDQKSVFSLKDTDNDRAVTEFPSFSEYKLTYNKKP